MALADRQAYEVDLDPVELIAVDSQLTELRRARTLARLRRAGLSERALATLLPDWGAHVADLAARSAFPIGLTIAD